MSRQAARFAENGIHVSVLPPLVDHQKRNEDIVFFVIADLQSYIALSALTLVLIAAG